MDDVNEVSFELDSDIDKVAATFLFDFVYDLANTPAGASARRAIKYIAEMKGVNYPLLECHHCGRIGSVLRMRYDGLYLCQDAQNCYRSARIELTDAVIVSIRQYQRNTIVSYWDGRDLPNSIEEYMKMEKPTIYKRIENYLFDGEGVISELRRDLNLTEK